MAEVDTFNEQLLGEISSRIPGMVDEASAAIRQRQAEAQAAAEEAAEQERQTRALQSIEGVDSLIEKQKSRRSKECQGGVENWNRWEAKYEALVQRRGFLESLNMYENRLVQMKKSGDMGTPARGRIEKEIARLRQILF
jgi:hypothetical protein